MYGRCDTNCVLCKAQLIKMSSYEWGDSFYCDTPNCNFRASIDGKSQNIDHYYFSLQIDGKSFEFYSSVYSINNTCISKIIDNSTKNILISFPYFTPYTDNYSHYHYIVNRYVKLRAFL